MPKLKSIEWSGERPFLVARISGLVVGTLHVNPRGAYSLNAHYDVRVLKAETEKVAKLEAEKLIESYILSLLED